MVLLTLWRLYLLRHEALATIGIDQNTRLTIASLPPHKTQFLHGSIQRYIFLLKANSDFELFM